MLRVAYGHAYVVNGELINPAHPSFNFAAICSHRSSCSGVAPYFPPPELRYVGTARLAMARRALASAAQLRELDGAWEKVAAELSAAVQGLLLCRLAGHADR